MNEIRNINWTKGVMPFIVTDKNLLKVNFLGTKAVADLPSKILDLPPLGVQILSISIMQFLGKFIVCWYSLPFGGLSPPPRGHPGSATVRAIY